MADITEVDYIWKNGELVPWAEATCHVLSHSLHYGSGVFEGIRCYKVPDEDKSFVFRLRDHMERLHRSCKIAQIELPYSVDELMDATLEVIRANKLPACYIRPLVYRGYGVMGVDPTGAPVDVVIAVWPWDAYLGADALENGVASIEHGARPDADILRLFRERGAFQISTISPAVPYALFDRSISHATYEQQENGKVVFEGIVALARACLQNGIPVGLGTDTGCPYITHYDMWRELCYFVKYCGVTPAFALYSATLLNAELAGISDITGSVEPGKAADLIVCDRDPLADLTALRSLHMVIKDGLRIESPAVKKMPEVERELDKFL